jgi:hypothetical protein
MIRRLFGVIFRSRFTVDIASMGVNRLFTRVFLQGNCCGCSGNGCSGNVVSRCIRELEFYRNGASDIVKNFV